jgi:hypothetical protein
LFLLSSHQNIQPNSGVQLKLKTSSGGEEPAAHIRRRRTSSSQEKVQEVKDELEAEPGGEGKLEASHHQ